MKVVIFIIKFGSLLFYLPYSLKNKINPQDKSINNSEFMKNFSRIRLASLFYFIRQLFKLTNYFRQLFLDIIIIYLFINVTYQSLFTVSIFCLINHKLVGGIAVEEYVKQRIVICRNKCKCKYILFIMYTFYDIL